MALVNLPITNIAIDYTFETTLDSVSYILGFRYNYRSGIWMLDISTSENVPVYMGIPIFINWDITSQIKSYDIPTGLLLCLNNLEGEIAPTRDTFSQDVVLLYNEAE